MNTPIRTTCRFLAISGTHGTGKTSAALSLTNKLKRRHPDKRVNLLTETAAECPLPINRSGSPDAQLWIFTRHVLREIELAAYSDIVVCDRSLVDPIAYTYILGFIPLGDAMKAMARPLIGRYEKIYLKSPKNNHCTDDGRRDMDHGFRMAVANMLATLYSMDLQPRKLCHD